MMKLSSTIVGAALLLAAAQGAHAQDGCLPEYYDQYVDAVTAQDYAALAALLGDPGFAACGELVAAAEEVLCRLDPAGCAVQTAEGTPAQYEPVPPPSQYEPAPQPSQYQPVPQPSPWQYDPSPAAPDCPLCVWADRIDVPSGPVPGPLPVPLPGASPHIDLGGLPPLSLPDRDGGLRVDAPASGPSGGSQGRLSIPGAG